MRGLRSDADRLAILLRPGHAAELVARVVGAAGPIDLRTLIACVPGHHPVTVRCALVALRRHGVIRRDRAGLYSRR